MTFWNTKRKISSLLFEYILKVYKYSLDIIVWYFIPKTNFPLKIVKTEVVLTLENLRRTMYRQIIILSTYSNHIVLLMVNCMCSCIIHFKCWFIITYHFKDSEKCEIYVLPMEIFKREYKIDYVNHIFWERTRRVYYPEKAQYQSNNMAPQ